MPTGTGYSGLWGSSLTTLVDRSTLERDVTRAMRRMKLRRRLSLSLNGAAAGAAALYTEGRVQASTGANAEQGGKRTIETNTFVNRNTTAADKTAIDGMLLKSSRPTYVVQPGQAQTTGAFSGRANMVA